MSTNRSQSKPRSKKPVSRPVTAPSDSERLLRVDEVANRLGVSVRTVWALRSNGQIPDSVKIGSATRWRRSEIESYIRGLNAAGR
jgi:excisionase family DNA binding protein